MTTSYHWHARDELFLGLGKETALARKLHQHGRLRVNAKKEEEKRGYAAEKETNVMPRCCRFGQQRQSGSHGQPKAHSLCFADRELKTRKYVTDVWH